MGLLKKIFKSYQILSAHINHYKKQNLISFTNQESKAVVGS